MSHRLEMRLRGFADFVKTVVCAMFIPLLLVGAFLGVLK